MSGRCTFGYSYFRTEFFDSQKSKEQRAVCREVPGEGPEDREGRKEGEGAEGGK